MIVHKWNNRGHRALLPRLDIYNDSVNVDVVIGWWKWNIEFIFKKKINAPFKEYKGFEV